MKRFGVLFLLLISAGLVTLSAQTKRTFTNPRPEPYFKALFPNAGGFSTFGGTPLHYKVYDVDPKANPTAPVVGFIFWTTDVMPNDYGYHGPVRWTVRGMLLIGPTAFGQNQAPDVPAAVLLPGCDNDVADLSGQIVVSKESPDGGEVNIGNQ